MKTIGILGCGWLGLHLSRHLLAKSYTVKGSTTTNDKLHELENIGINPFLLDLQHIDEGQLHSFLQEVDCLIITIPPKRGEDNPTYQNSFSKLLPYLHQNKVHKVIMMSSVSVYESSEDVVTETGKTNTNDPTSKQILAAEAVLQSETQLTSCILRLGGLFGPDRRPVQYIVNRGVLDNPELPINMIHLQDILAFTTALIEQDCIPNEIYNLVSPHYKNRLDYYTKEAQELHLILPPLGENDWKTKREISGQKIVHQTGLSYQR